MNFSAETDPQRLSEIMRRGREDARWIVKKVRGSAPPACTRLVLLSVDRSLLSTAQSATRQFTSAPFVCKITRWLQHAEHLPCDGVLLQGGRAGWEDRLAAKRVEPCVHPCAVRARQVTAGGKGSWVTHVYGHGGSSSVSVTGAQQHRQQQATVSFRQWMLTDSYLRDATSVLAGTSELRG